jgi:acetyl esterase/lipase
MATRGRFAERGIKAVRAHLAALPPAASLTLAERRAQYDKVQRVFPVPEDVQIETVASLMPGTEWLRPAGARSDRAVLYLHGGGYVIGSPRSHRHLAAAIARGAEACALVPDYRLAPEHRFPAAVDDAVATYRWLLDRGVAPGSVAIAGDSAGGGLTAATLVALRDRGVPLPAAAVCISPWTDLTCTAGTYATLAGRDPIVTTDGVAEMARHYVGDGDRRAPLASPLFADLAGLPPLLIQVGSEEVLLDDARLLAERAERAGVPTSLEVWPDMIHVWHWFFPMLDEGQTAIDGIAAFLSERLAKEA